MFTHAQQTFYKSFLKFILFFIFFLSAFSVSFFASSFLLSIAFNKQMDIFFTFFPFLILGGFLLSVLMSFKLKPRQKIQSPQLIKQESFDIDRRFFLKTLGSLGLGGLVYFLFTRKAQAIQFGGTGVPDPIGIEPLGSSQTTGSVTLTDVNTWYQVPASNQASRVFLVLHNRSGYDMYWTFDNAVSASNGGLLFPSGGTLQFDAGSAINVYMRCGTAGQVCWYAESQSQ